MLRRVIICAPIAMSFLAVAAGCRHRSYPTATLSGTVTVDRRPVNRGGITFTPVQPGAGRGVYAEVHAGRYQAKRVPIGRVRALVMAVRATGRTVATSGTTIPEVESLLPPRYDGGIDVDVVRDDPAFDFDLTSTQ